jgi:DNA repair/transcription protein MET18/MMS19
MQVRLPCKDLVAWIQSLLVWSVRESGTWQETTAVLHIVSSTVNKKIDGAFFPLLSHTYLYLDYVELSTLLAVANDVFWPEEVASTAADLASRRRAISAWTWLSKALIVRNHPSAAPFAQRLFELFRDKDPMVAWDAARALGTIGGSDKVLAKRNHAVIRVRHPGVTLVIDN